MNEFDFCKIWQNYSWTNPSCGHSVVSLQWEESSASAVLRGLTSQRGSRGIRNDPCFRWNHGKIVKYRKCWRRYEVRSLWTIQHFRPKPNRNFIRTEYRRWASLLFWSDINFHNNDVTNDIDSVEQFITTLNEDLHCCNSFGMTVVWRGQSYILNVINLLRHEFASELSMNQVASAL